MSGLNVGMLASLFSVFSQPRNRALGNTRQSVLLRKFRTPLQVWRCRALACSGASMSDDDTAFGVDDDASSFELGDEVEQLPAPQDDIDAVDVDDHSAVHTEGVTPLEPSSPSAPAASAPAVGGRSRRARAKVDYASINAGSMGYGEGAWLECARVRFSIGTLLCAICSRPWKFHADPKRFEQLLATKHFTKPIVRELTGDQLTKEWVRARALRACSIPSWWASSRKPGLQIEHHGFRVPLLIRDSEGLDITVPSQDFTVRDVVRLVGSSTPLEVFDVSCALLGLVAAWLHTWVRRLRPRPRSAT